MNKLFITLTLFFTSIGWAFADGQSCSISDDSNSSIMIVSDNCDGSKITLNLENDSKDITANVTVAIEVVYKNGASQKIVQKNGYARCPANSSKKIEIPIDSTIGVYTYSSYRIISINGAKCK